MKTTLFLTFAIVGAIVLASCSTPMEPNQTPLMTIKQYPVTTKEEKTLDFFGTSVSDPYMWLENDTAANTEAWVEQIVVTRGYLDSIPFRQKIKDRFTELFNFEKVGAPVKAGDYYFMFRNSGLEPQGKYFVRNGETGTEEVFLDVNALSANGTTSAGLLGADDSN
ncbi:MAG: S9 family peptidase, partial [Flavobacteriales bacterium]